MPLHASYARFFRSLNCDHIRAASDTDQRDRRDDTLSDAQDPLLRPRVPPVIPSLVDGNAPGKSWHPR